MLVYGCQKMLGVFGGQGFAATVSGFQKGMGIPPVFAMLSIAVEFFGAMALIAGLLTPAAALGMTVNMAVATYFSIKGGGGLGEIFASGDPAHLSKAFYPLLLTIASFSILLLGAGKYSLDAKFFRRGK